MKTHQMYSVYTTQQSPVILALCLRKIRSGKSHSSVFKMFSGIFKFSRFKERFQGVLFSFRINEDKSKVAFSHFFGEMWTGPKQEI